MKDNLVIILIISHKPTLTHEELISLKQCFKILGHYPIHFICPRGLNVEAYHEISENIHFDFIDPVWQSSYENFNKLKMSNFLYSKYSKYKYILFYEPDAFVFRDELEHWCNQGFDYLGAPWFEGWANADYNAKIIGVGNGGFSLRNVSKTIQLIDKNSFILILQSFFSHLFQMLFHSSGSKPLIELYKISRLMFTETKNEDFYLVEKAKLYKSYKVAPPEVAMRFAFDANPERLFEITGRKLPFGCHAWYRFAPKFWSQYIN